MQQDWDLFSAVFHEATGNNNLGTALWVDVNDEDIYDGAHIN